MTDEDAKTFQLIETRLNSDPARSRYKNFSQKINYRAILALDDNVIKRFDAQDVQEYITLGPKTPHGNWKLIVFNRPMDKRFIG